MAEPIIRKTANVTTSSTTNRKTNIKPSLLVPMAVLQQHCVGAHVHREALGLQAGLHVSAQETFRPESPHDRVLAPEGRRLEVRGRVLQSCEVDLPDKRCTVSSGWIMNLDILEFIFQHVTIMQICAFCCPCFHYYCFYIIIMQQSLWSVSHNSISKGVGLFGRRGVRLGNKVPSMTWVRRYLLLIPTPGRDLHSQMLSSSSFAKRVRGELCNISQPCYPTYQQPTDKYYSGHMHYNGFILSSHFSFLL